MRVPLKIAIALLVATQAFVIFAMIVALILARIIALAAQSSRVNPPTSTRSRGPLGSTLT